MNELEWIRTERGLSQQQLADQVGCRRTLISEIENGHRKPSKSLLRDLCSVLDVDEEDLV